MDVTYDIETDRDCDNDNDDDNNDDDDDDYETDRDTTYLLNYNRMMACCWCCSLRFVGTATTARDLYN